MSQGTGMRGRPAIYRAQMLEQNYRVKREVCKDCKYFEDGRSIKANSKILYPTQPSRWVRDDAGMRCGLGGFAVKPTATCDKFDRHEEA
jgi:hypothetical protein